MKKSDKPADPKPETPRPDVPPDEAIVPAPAPAAEELAALRERAAKADEFWDRLLRTTADLENFKKRAARERIEAGQAASIALLQKLLPVLDHFEMAQSAAQTAAAPPSGIQSLQAGIAMVQQQFKSILAESGLEEIDATGKPFDPLIHEAVSQIETADVPEGQVVRQVRKGYRLRERLLRPATVIVAKKPSAVPNDHAA